MTPIQNRVAFYTLGCKLNFSETSAISRDFSSKGFEVVDFEEVADVYVINTCSVTDHADRKTKKVVREARTRNRDAKVAIIGCYAQLKPEEIISIPGVDVVLGAKEKFNLPEHLEKLTSEGEKLILNSPVKDVKHFEPAFSVGDRTRSFLKVQDGCDYFCSFCTIPLARGTSRSSDISSVLDCVKDLEKNGIQEVVLTGVNIGDFKNEKGETFFDLVKALEEKTNIERYRISSIEPNLLDNEIIEYVARSGRFVPHFHIPLQSGSDVLLEKMRRRYRTDLYASRIKKIRELMPHACIGVDVIVGFPGETEEEFMKTMTFLKDLDISYLHVFTYSERPNTTAVRMGQEVPNNDRTRRRKMLQDLSHKKRMEFYRKNLGMSGKVLFEEADRGGEMFGFTENYIKVKTSFSPELANQIVDVKLMAISEDGLMKVRS